MTGWTNIHEAVLRRLSPEGRGYYDEYHRLLELRKLEFEIHSRALTAAREAGVNLNDVDASKLNDLDAEMHRVSAMLWRHPQLLYRPPSEIAHLADDAIANGDKRPRRVIVSELHTLVVPPEGLWAQCVNELKGEIERGSLRLQGKPMVPNELPWEVEIGPDKLRDTVLLVDVLPAYSGGPSSRIVKSFSSNKPYFVDLQIKKRDQGGRPPKKPAVKEELDAWEAEAPGEPARQFKTNQGYFVELLKQRLRKSGRAGGDVSGTLAIAAFREWEADRPD